MKCALVLIAAFVSLGTHSILAQSQRVVAIVSIGSWAPATDSVRYHYSGGRGSVFNYDFMEYDHGYREFGKPDNTLAENLLYPDRTPQVACDRWTSWKGSGFSDSGNTGTISYNAGGNVTEHAFYMQAGGSTVDFSPRYTAEYDASGRRTWSTRWRWDGGPWQSPTTRYIRYDTLGRMLTDSLGDGYEYFYEYGLLGKPDAVLYRRMIVPNYYVTHQAYLIKYNSDTLISSIVTSLIGPASTYYKDSFTYYPGTRFIQDWFKYDNGGGTLRRAVKKHINPQNNLPDTVLRMEKFLTSWDTTQTIFTYNSHNNPESSHSYRRVNGAWETTPYQVRRFYYEEYDPAVVADVPSADLPPLLFPNPAQDIVQLRYDGAASGADMRLYDLHGRVVLQAPLRTGGDTELSIASIPPNIYFYHIVTQGRVVGRGKLVKQ